MLTEHLPLMLILGLKVEVTFVVVHLYLVTKCMRMSVCGGWVYFGSSLSMLTIVGFRALRRSRRLLSSAILICLDTSDVLVGLMLAVYSTNAL